MKRILPLAALAVLGLGIAGFATIVLAQGSDQPLPPPTGPAVAVPGAPGGEKPKPPVPAVPGLNLPGEPETPAGSGPALPPPSDPIVTPGGPMLPPAGGAITIPPAGGAAAKPPAPPAGVVSLPGSADAPVKISDAGPKGISSPPAGGTETEKPAESPRPVSAAGGEESAPADNLPTGRQEPAVSLEWIGPGAAKVGQPSDYSIAVRNVSNVPVQQVLVRVRLNQGMQVVATEPKAVTEENVLMWEVGTMLPKQERNLQLRMVAPQKGDATCQAWVTFTGAAALRVHAREPKLMIKAAAPDKVMVGDPCTYVVTVSNPGDLAVEQVKIHCTLSEGLEHIKGNKVDYDIGTLAPGETRAVQVICGTKAGGEQLCEAYAEAEGGLKAVDKAVANVVMPRIDLDVSGPKLKYLDRKAVYTLKVTNPGDAPAYNVMVSDEVPAGFKFLQADNGGRHDFATHTVSWFLGEIGPGQSREVKLECLAVAIGDHQHKARVQASRGLKKEELVVTKVKGLSAIMLEMVDLDDPIEVGGETSYEIRITNTGSETETDVRLVCTVPDKMQFKGATGPVKFTQNGSEVVFESIPRLAPRADAIFRITVKTTAAGVVNFKSRITSTLLAEGVTKEEATRIYAD